MICRARLYPCEGFSEDIGDDVWVTCLGKLILGTLYAYREGLIDKLDMDADETSYWSREGYQMTAYKTSMGDKEANEHLEAFHSCEIPVIRILEMDNRNMDDIGDINEILDCYAD